MHVAHFRRKCLTARNGLRRPRSPFLPRTGPTRFDARSSRGRRPEWALREHPHVLGLRVAAWEAVLSGAAALTPLFPHLSPPQNTPTARPRAAACVVPSERQWVTQRPRRDVERAPRTVGVPPVARLHQQARASGPWVVPQLKVLVQPGQLVRTLGGGPLPHAMTQHHSSAPPRHARPTRRVRADRMW